MSETAHYTFTDRYGVESAEDPPIPDFEKLLDSVAETTDDDDFRAVSIENEHGWAMSFSPGWASLENVERGGEDLGRMSVVRDQAMALVASFIEGGVDAVRRIWSPVREEPVERVEPRAPLPGVLGVMLGAVGEEQYSEQGFALQRLADGPSETGELPDGGVSINYPDYGLIAAYTSDSEGTLTATAVVAFAQQVDGLIAGLDVKTASRDDVRQSLGAPVRSSVEADVFAVDDKFVGVDFDEAGRASTVTAALEIDNLEGRRPMEKITDFRPLIVKMTSVKSDLDAVDENNVFPNRLPAVAASDEQIAATENELGLRFDDEHRSFLSFADGWPTFNHNGDLFSLEEISSARQQLIEASADDDGDDDEETYDISQLLPIGAAEETDDIFVMPIRDGQVLPEVIWVGGGEEVDRFDSFAQFFASMIAYSEQLVESVRQGEYQ